MSVLHFTQTISDISIKSSACNNVYIPKDKSDVVIARENVTDTTN